MGPEWNRSWMSISLAADPRKGAESLRKWFLIIQLRHSIMDFDLMARGKKKETLMSWLSALWNTKQDDQSNGRQLGRLKLKLADDISAQLSQLVGLGHTGTCQ